MIVEVEQGKLYGRQSTSILTGKIYCSFLGIPYAKPPIGELRFRAPERAEKWDNIYDATYERDECYQRDFASVSRVKGSENCLYLNVHTPEPPDRIKTAKAVMVFFHGGAFYTGSGSEKVYSADYLINEDIILVTINYRLHVLGFLNLDIPSCPGNVGLKDQVLALQWIRDNIRQFGGDSENVTIFGESAGASSVNYHMISPLSKGLFHKAIMESGSVLSPWAFTRDPRTVAFEIGKKLGYKGNDSEKLVQFLRNQSAENICLAHSQILDEKSDKYPATGISTICTPSVELLKENDQAFLPDSLEKLLNQADPVPVIYGVNSDEAVIIHDMKPNLVSVLRKDFSAALRDNFEINSSSVSSLAARVKEFYFNAEEIGEKTKHQVANLYTDIYFFNFYEAMQFVYRSSEPCYIYEFQYVGEFNWFRRRRRSEADMKSAKGASHEDELGYLFAPAHFQNSRFRSNELQMIRIMTLLWTNFAKTGNPTHRMEDIEWRPHTPKDPCYLKINLETEMADGYVYENRIANFKSVLGPGIGTVNC